MAHYLVLFLERSEEVDHLTHIAATRYVTP